MTEENEAYQETTAGSPDGSTNMAQSSTSNANGESYQILHTQLHANVELPVARTSSKSSSPNHSGPSNPNFPPPKTDKPRPHICATCTRSFARLEHLKRHERSHTKEKPFECPECSRCFARRDLLLRHQQKLHSTTTPSSKPRSGRRESAAGVAGGRVRKNSVVNNGNSSGTRPRANTFSTLDSATLGMLSNSGSNAGRNFHTGHSHHNSLNGLSGGTSFDYRGMSTGHHAGLHGLPKLETSLSSDLSGGLRTAPPYGGFGVEYGIHNFEFGTTSANTINPHALHLNGLHGLGVDAPASPYQQMFPTMHTSHTMNEDDSNFDWIAQGFESHMSFVHANESAIETSSPSAMSTNSPEANSDAMLDSNGITVSGVPAAAINMWGNPMVSQAHMVNSPAIFDFSASTFNEMLPPASAETVSPKSLLAQNGHGVEIGLSTPPPLSGIDPSVMVPGYPQQPFQLPFAKHGGASTASISSMDSSVRQSSTTTMPGELISEHIRNILIASLSQNSGFGQRNYSQPSISSPLSPREGSRTNSFNINNFPNTQDLQRYVSAYIDFFHPHLPFLHIPSLSFESPEYTTPLRTVNGPQPFGQSGIAGGGGCLILSIAAIGALYEHEMASSRELFECAKRLINCYLEERRKCNMSKAQFSGGHPSESEDTPLWLVQAMLLNVIFGHNCGDKVAADIASRHCAALVSLARGAELARPYPAYMAANGMASGVPQHDLHMTGMGAEGWSSILTEPDDSDWYGWRIMEERKRTLYAVFILSSLLVSAYNHPPALTNSEIRLDLPCDEELWSAESAQTWRGIGGVALAESRAIPFGAALGHLLTAAQRQQRRPSNAGVNAEDPPESELKPSTFGCLILVNALHNYIWETRQRHLGRQWTAQETEQMHAHIEPALRAWQAAWASNPCHSLERPNPFGAGPLSADSIPLLDLAYVRLFVNLGRSKEAFWQRDYDAMADELARGVEVVQHAGTSPSPGSDESDLSNQSNESASRRGSSADVMSSEGGINQAPSDDPRENHPLTNIHQQSGQALRRERHLRKAAFYAADSLLMSDKLGLSFAEHTSRELPLQSAMCAFDCAQVLAEWVTTVQDRVGRYLGIMGKDEVDLLQVPGIILLEDEDRKLLEKVEEVLVGAEGKIARASGASLLDEGGYGSKILALTAQMLERAAVWPGKRTARRWFAEERLTCRSHEIDGSIIKNTSGTHDEPSADFSHESCLNAL